MAENSLAIGQLVNLITEHSKLKPLFNEYEAELHEFQRLGAANEQMREHLNSLTLDHMLVSEAFATMNEQRDEHNKANAIVELCYSQTLKIEQLLKHEKFDNICKYTILVKQNKAKSMLESLESRNISEMDNMAILESRQIVMQLRHLQGALERSIQELNIVKQSTKDCQYRTRLTLEWATDQLNRKILNLLIKRNELIELKQELAQSKTNKTQQQHHPLVQDPSVSSIDGSLNKSALDFLNNFSNGPTANKIIPLKVNNNSEETPLRSILVVDSNRSSSSPNKQVRFAPSPVNLDEEDDNMTGIDNWDALVEQMDVHFDNLDQLPLTLESAMVISTNSPKTFAQSSTDNIIASDINPTTSLNAFGDETKFGQSSNNLVTLSEIVPTTSRNDFVPVTASNAKPATSPNAFAHGTRFDQSSMRLVTSSEILSTSNSVTATFSDIFENRLAQSASDSNATTIRDAFAVETLNTENQSGNSASEDTMSDDQDGSGSTMVFSAANDDFFLNFSDEMNGHKVNDDYEL